MRLLLTSGGVTNPSILRALENMLDKPISESNALCIPTAIYALRGGAMLGWRFISGNEPENPMCDLGWKSIGVLELSALASVDKERWVPTLMETDVLLVHGGDTLFLCHWMRESGFADLIPDLKNVVYVSLSAGSMVMTPSIGEKFISWKPPSGNLDTLGVVDFSIFPHLDHESLPTNTMAHAESWAATMSAPAYAIDDATAIKVVDGNVEVISEGQWKYFER